jgi:D-threo-aldose 1-dehydrogenase
VRATTCPWPPRRCDSVAHPSVISVIPYHNAPGQVRQNLDWMKYPAPDALWADLRQEGLIRPEAPTPD